MKMPHLFRALLFAAATLASANLARAADNFTPAGSQTTTFRSKDVGSGTPLQIPFQVPSDATGLPIFAAGNPGYVTIAGSVPLPTGAATAALQTTGNTSLSSILTALGSPLQAAGAVSVSNLPATQAVSATALPLPTGAATAAKQPALGTAGTPSADVITVQGSAAGVPQPVDTVRQSTATDAGGTITAGSTAQTFMASNTSRRGFSVQNQSTGDLYINCSATATLDYHSLKIPTGALYESSPSHVGTAACSIIGATTGQAFYGRQF